MNNRLLVVTVCLMLGALVGEAVAQVPAVSDETRSIRGELTAAQKAEIDAFLRYYAEKMAGAMETPVVSASSAEVVKLAAQMVAVAYGKDNGTGYMRYFVESAGPNFADIVFKSEQPLVLVNAGVVLSKFQIPQVSPVLGQLVAHPNAAVRYYGLKTYSKIRDILLERPSPDQAEMFKALNAMAEEETSPVVLTALLKVIDPSAAGSGATKPQALYPAGRIILAASVKRNLQAVRDGDSSICTVCSQAVALAGILGGAANQADRKDLLQLVAEVLTNAERAYGDCFVTDPEGKASKLDRADDLETLLIDSERALMRLTAAVQSPVANEIRSSSPGQASRVALAVWKWVGTKDVPGLLNIVDVQTPTPLSPSSKPATQPTDRKTD
ncbi:MAG: hypothetical protein HQ546_09230 [Planctomycetes bacterium]|nr:hypothetical protein [Planctomycetota bacterium]